MSRGRARIEQHARNHAHGGSDPAAIEWEDVGAGGGAAAGGWVLIDDILMTGTTASADFASIPGIYAHLALWIFARGSDSSGLVGVYLRFNGDSGNNYHWQLHAGTGLSGSANQGVGVAQAYAGDVSAN